MPRSFALTFFGHPTLPSLNHTIMTWRESSVYQEAMSSARNGMSIGVMELARLHINVGLN